ncbi:hypothetical protein KR51_00005740 [Rubidibacter lacunae KORDI 51-2]|uniref:Uncharacterized protein n=1 Tax=Rubidibacter lacunae KORDI 51-2 TaxID=582515 RepID=U5DPF0_9CHRO|nr:Npun_F0494 family protein [Rubidibacter lacunae]ERN42727.1 hypothetical protein KR51_00005740 [Rubidibacter lacunae KORDI 51-2]
MTTASPQDEIQYPAATIARADLALRCSPFFLALFADMRQQGVALPAIADKRGIDNGYARRALTELAAEAALMWLIQVGMLRREVDGQGITDKFRLTLLGRQIVAEWEDRGTWTPPTWRDRLQNFLNRRARLPF